MSLINRRKAKTTGDGTGPAGPQGPKGDTGAVGPAGAKGDIGATGPAGPTGPQGTAGRDGVMGQTGATGPAGPEGARGPAGTTGPTGPQGVQGPTGPTGVSGLTFRGAYSIVTAYNMRDAVSYEGSTYYAPLDIQAGVVPPASPWAVLSAAGATGMQGPTGATGPAGPAGPQGIQGVAGAVGATGPRGLTGDTGPQGIQGVQGERGLTGATGAAGATGPAGPTGAQGAAGARGATGATGASGLDYTYQRWTNVATGVGDVALPGSPLLFLRVNRTSTGSIQWTIVSATTTARYVDWSFEAHPGPGSSSTITTGGGTSTLGSTTLSQAVVNSNHVGFRKLQILIKDWGTKRIIECNCYMHGRAADDSRPALIEMRSFPY